MEQVGFCVRYGEAAAQTAFFHDHESALIYAVKVHGVVVPLYAPLK